MKRIYLASIASLLFLPLPAAAEPFCFMHHQGRTIDLTSMCGNTQAATPSLAPVTSGGASQRTAIVYADAYCQARSRGMNDRQSIQTASDIAGEYSVMVGMPRSAINEAWYEQARSASVSMCPDLQPTF